MKVVSESAKQRRENFGNGNELHVGKIKHVLGTVVAHKDLRASRNELNGLQIDSLEGFTAQIFFTQTRT